MTHHKHSNETTTTVSDLHDRLTSLSDALHDTANEIKKQKEETAQQARENSRELLVIIANNIPAYDEKMAAIVTEEEGTPLGGYGIAKLRHEHKDLEGEIRAFLTKHKHKSYDHILEEAKAARESLDTINAENEEVHEEGKQYRRNFRETFETISRFNRLNPGKPITLKTLEGEYAPVNGFWKSAFKKVFDTRFRKARAVLDRLGEEKTKELVRQFRYGADLAEIEAGTREDLEVARKMFSSYMSEVKELDRMEGRKKEIQERLSPRTLLPLLQASVFVLIGEPKYHERLTKGWKEADKIKALECATRINALNKMGSFLNDKEEEVSSSLDNISLAISRLKKAVRSGMRSRSIKADLTELHKAEIAARCETSYIARNAKAMRGGIQTYTVQSNTSSSDCGSIWMWLYLYDHIQGEQGEARHAVDPSFLSNSLNIEPERIRELDLPQTERLEEVLKAVPDYGLDFQSLNPEDFKGIPGIGGNETMSDIQSILDTFQQNSGDLCQALSSPSTLVSGLPTLTESLNQVATVVGGLSEGAGDVLSIAVETPTIEISGSIGGGDIPGCDM